MGDGDDGAGAIDAEDEALSGVMASAAGHTHREDESNRPWAI
jgi:hypothetical protein